MRLLLTLAVLSAAGPASATATEWTVVTRRADPPAALAGPVRAALAKDALDVKSDAGEVVVTLWPRPTLPVRATAGQVKNGLTAAEVPPGTLVGAVEFPAAFTDYRKQDIPAGVYTLRSAVQPAVGDHAGTAPHPDFLILSPAAADLAIDAVEAAELVKRGTTSAGGSHPAVMLVWPHAGKGTKPAVVAKAGGVRVLTVTLAVETDAGVDAKLGLGLTVAGYSKSRD